MKRQIIPFHRNGPVSSDKLGLPVFVVIVVDVRVVKCCDGRDCCWCSAVAVDDCAAVACRRVLATRTPPKS
jgi:hypothetical protein